jgi:hypothetical protein
MLARRLATLPTMMAVAPHRWSGIPLRLDVRDQQRPRLGSEGHIAAPMPMRWRTGLKRPGLFWSRTTTWASSKSLKGAFWRAASVFNT